MSRNIGKCILRMYLLNRVWICEEKSEAWNIPLSWCSFSLCTWKYWTWGQQWASSCRCMKSETKYVERETKKKQHTNNNYGSMTNSFLTSRWTHHEQMDIGEDVFCNWTFFRWQWEKSEIAAELNTKPSQASTTGRVVTDSKDSNALLCYLSRLITKWSGRWKIQEVHK